MYIFGILSNLKRNTCIILIIVNEYVKKSTQIAT